MSMTIEEALEIVVARTGHGRWRELCDPGHPDYNPDYIPVVLEMAGRPTRAEYPSLAAQVGNVVRAAGRIVAAAVTGQVMGVDDAEQARRLAICAACEHFDAQAQKCRQCGCLAKWKARLATEHCPLPEPKW